MLRASLLLVSMLTVVISTAQTVWMHPNAGQWDDRIEYKVELESGEMYIEKDGFTYNLNNGAALLSHNHEEEGHDHHDDVYKAHVVKTKFVGSQWQGQSIRNAASYFYRNYLLGNDKSKWKSELHSYAELELIDFYEGVDLRLLGNDGLKYELRVDPNVPTNIIRLSYVGQDRLFIDKEGNLHITNRFGEIIEGKPVAWTVSENGEQRREVAVQFKLEGNEVSFEFPNGYDATQQLIIDPDITFSTFTGSVADNWGMSATPDPAGNAFGGGVVFSAAGYPVTSGAFDTSFNPGTPGQTNVDVAITKFTADGTNLIYSTYLGGTGSETPNSMVCAPNGELFIYGITASNDFPMGPSPYDGTFNGGSALTSGEANYLGFTQGSDIYVARLNAAGTALLASTYVGGTANDGFNHGPLLHNYGDQFRGEIILDPTGNVYVASSTRSFDFPVVSGPSGSISGTSDAVIFKMPPALNTLTWSGYYGGSGYECGNSVQIAANGDVFVAGGTTSSNLQLGSGYDVSFNGQEDGYLVRLSGLTGGVMSGTYIGLNEYDQAYFVQLDLDDNVYVLGQTESDLGITSGHYGNANSGQFIHKFDHNLSMLEWKTMIGASSGHVEISPTAFLVSDCYDIYLSGWGGSLNATNGNAPFSSTNGFPITSNAYQSTTTGSNFFIAVLSKNALVLKYGTYMGGMVTSSPNHVDGGTSRFDKDGFIYHAVCASCGSATNGFTTTPGVWAPTAGSSNCNMAVFKFELSVLEALVNTPNTVICWPDPVQFNNNSANGNGFFWDFDDGTTSTQVNPTHNYASPGIYDVMLIVTDTNGCYLPDTTFIQIELLDFNGAVQNPTGPICPGDTLQLQASGGATYAWSPGQYLSDSTIADPLASVEVTTTFTVIVSDTCGVDTLTVTVDVFNDQSTVIDDQDVCIGNSVQLFATGGGSYTWSPGTYLDDSTSSTPMCTPTDDIIYYVEIITPNGCIIEDTVVIDVFFTPPQPVMPDHVYMCEGQGITIEVSGADNYYWSPNVAIQPTTGPVVVVNPSQDMYYYCSFENACGAVLDSVFVEIVEATIEAFSDTIICPGETVDLWATGGLSYTWWPSNTLNIANTSLVTAKPTAPTMYTVQAIDSYGCINQDSVFVDLYPAAFIQTSPDVYAFYGDEIQLTATTSTPAVYYTWSPPEFLTCVSCQSPVANPNQDYTYLVTYIDDNGCKATDSVHIYYDPIIYVPNTFTPGGLNPIFKAEGGNIKTFEMNIFNRWGELIFTSNDMEIGWDGTYQGAKSQDGTYVWKIKISDFRDNEQEFVGHINLLR